MKTVNFKQTGYGQWSAITTYYGKEISMHFTDAPTVDLITSQDKGWKIAEKLLRFRIIQANK
jgi:hypothetical protein